MQLSHRAEKPYGRAVRDVAGEIRRGQTSSVDFIPGEQELLTEKSNREKGPDQSFTLMRSVENSLATDNTEDVKTS